MLQIVDLFRYTFSASNTWISPSVRGDGPEPREGHSAALIGRRLFIFGGCGKSEGSEIYYDDLYVLNTGALLTFFSFCVCVRERERVVFGQVKRNS